MSVLAEKFIPFISEGIFTSYSHCLARLGVCLSSVICNLSNVYLSALITVMQLTIHHNNAN